MARDLIHTRSARRVLYDIRCASRKVTRSGIRYNGDVPPLFGRDDTLIRWQAVFSGCLAPDDIPAPLVAYRRAEFPVAARLRAAVLSGDHLGPERAAEEYAREAFAMLGL